MAAVVAVVMAEERAGTKQGPRDQRLHQQPYPAGQVAHPAAGWESTDSLSTFVGNVGPKYFTSLVTLDSRHSSTDSGVKGNSIPLPARWPQGTVRTLVS